MIDLYRKFASDRYSSPIANIIRSFTATTEGKKRADVTAFDELPIIILIVIIGLYC